MAAWISLRLLPGSKLLLSCPISRGQACIRGVGRTSTTPGALSAYQDKLRTMEDLPHVRQLELLYRMVFQGFHNRLHELQILEKQLYGPIYVSGFKVVAVNSPQLLEELLRKDQKFPSRGDMTLWTEYRDMSGLGYGPFTEEGERWYQLRAVLNKRMLHPKDSAQYGGIINEVVADFNKRIRYLRQLSPTGDLVPDVSKEFYMFSLEAKTLINKKMEDIQQRLDKDQDVQGGYLTYLLSYTQMSAKDVYASITELLLAGVDTTSNTLTWTLYQLSKNPKVQDRLYEEVSTSLPADQIPTAAEVTRLPYLRAVIRETLRMYPVVPMNGRHMTERPVSVGGYLFPEKTSFGFSHYAMSYDQDVFPEPFTFKPERWLRDGRQKPNPFGSIPFGFGVRGCVGRRIAELEMYLVLFQLIRQFEVKANPRTGDLKSINRTVLVPDKKLNLHFVDRG
ncbi:sterol 26-hydroxylase, mitochondrial isoform X2 [Nothobranchius furzeri]|uniref:Transcript variant X2 n=1 Tax=Nothobranchius furzeri TaxID=105023 RepID=A0A9D2Y6C6_NOTFU|nr:transcript variant X2 [Nothobranchius furzeri]